MTHFLQQRGGVITLLLPYKQKQMKLRDLTYNFLEEKRMIFYRIGVLELFFFYFS